MASTQKPASGQNGPKGPEKKKNPKKRNPKKKTSSTPSPSSSQAMRVEKVEVEDVTFQVGEEYEVLHFSSLRWQKLELKKIEHTASGVIQFSFFSNPPGWMTVGVDRVRPIKAKKRKGRQRG